MSMSVYVMTQIETTTGHQTTTYLSIVYEVTDASIESFGHQAVLEGLILTVLPATKL